MIPVVAGEYKLVLVGDSAVGNLVASQENPHCLANLWMAISMNISSRPSVSTSNLDGSSLKVNR